LAAHSRIAFIYFPLTFKLTRQGNSPDRKDKV